MKIVVTGSLGHISKPLTQMLVQKGHAVTVISSKGERQHDIEAIGAKPAIGTMEDAGFLAATFTGADTIYTMTTLGAGTGAFFDHSTDVTSSLTKIGSNYKQAIQQAGVKQVVHLSSIGADKGTGLLRFHYNVENILRELPNDVSIKFMRPVGFYYNMFSFIPSIKAMGAIISNYGGDEKEPWVSPLDIAAVIADEIDRPFNGREVRYIASDEVSPNEIAEILGIAIKKPDLKWIEIADEQLLKNLVDAGMNPQTAKGFMQMNAARRGGILYEDYYQNKPALGNVKLPDFAKEFAAVYNQ